MTQFLVNVGKSLSLHLSYHCLIAYSVSTYGSKFHTNSKLL